MEFQSCMCFAELCNDLIIYGNNLLPCSGPVFTPVPGVFPGGAAQEETQQQKCDAWMSKRKQK